MNVWKTVCGIVLVLVKLQKHLVFTTAHICLISQVSMCHPEAYSKPCQTSKMEVFCENVQRLLTVNYCRKTLHFRYLRGLSIRLCHLRHKFSTCILNQVKREHIPINFLRFSIKNSSDKVCVFAALNKFFVCL